MNRFVDAPAQGKQVAQVISADTDIQHKFFYGSQLFFQCIKNIRPPAQVCQAGAFINRHAVNRGSGLFICTDYALYVFVCIFRGKFGNDKSADKCSAAASQLPDPHNLLRAAHADKYFRQVKIPVFPGGTDAVQGSGKALLGGFYAGVLDGIFQAQCQGKAASEFLAGNGRGNGFTVCRTVEERTSAVIKGSIFHSVGSFLVFYVFF